MSEQYSSSETIPKNAFAMFEMVSQKQGQVEKEQTFYFERLSKHSEESSNHDEEAQEIPRLKPISENQYQERLGKVQDSPKRQELKFFKIITQKERQTIKEDIKQVLRIQQARKEKEKQVNDEKPNENEEESADEKPNENKEKSPEKQIEQKAIIKPPLPIKADGTFRNQFDNSRLQRDFWADTEEVKRQLPPVQIPIKQRSSINSQRSSSIAPKKTNMYDRHMKFLRPREYQMQGTSQLQRGGSGHVFNSSQRMSRDSEFKNLDKIIGRDMKTTQIFNRGQNLRGGLLNSEAIIQSVQADKWKDAIKMFEKNPKMLLDQMPSPTRLKKSSKYNI